MIEEFVRGLEEAARVLTPEAIAESLWLARFLPAPGVSPDAGGSAVDPSSERPGRPWTPTEHQPPPPSRPAEPRGDAPQRNSTANFYLAGGAPVEMGPSVIHAGSPAVPALPNALRLSRALGALRHAMPAQQYQELDDVATADYIAATGVVEPVFRPTRDGWLDLVLVVDQSPSMVVWSSTVTELRTIVRRQNAFNRLRTWRMRSDGRHEPRLSSELTDSARDPRELLDVSSNQLILIFSDCIDEMWKSRKMRTWLELWGRHHPVAIALPLPQRLWHRCCPNVHMVQLHPPRAGAPNSLYRPRLRGELDQRVPSGSVAIPVLELRPDWLSSEVALITGRTAGQVNAAALLTREPEGYRDEDEDEDFTEQPELDPVEAVRRFRASASPIARKLAEFLAAAPLTLPVMRLVQRLALPQSQPQDLAEVYLSGLINRVTPLDEDVRADRVVYDYRKGIRQALLPNIRAAEALAVLDEVSVFINQRMGTSFDFPALLAGHETGVPAVDLGQPFASVAREVLQTLGGRYAGLAQRLLHFQTVSAEEPDNPQPDQPPHDLGGPVSEPNERPDATTARYGRPAIWGDVPPRNPVFTGREELLRNLRRHLTNRATALLPHTLHGLGGVGKTQLAVEYAYRFEADYDLVWWVPAEQSSLYRQSLMALARRLDLVSATEADVTRALSSVYDALRTGRPYARWLLVFDNANRPEDLAPFLSNPGGHLLVTSRNYNWSGIAQTVEVDVFTPEESVELLRRRLRNLGESDAQRLAMRLGNLPLALEQAATWILETGIELDDYLDSLDKRAKETLQEGSSSTYKTPVADVFGLAFDGLEEQSLAALQLLELCAFFGAEPISMRLLPVGRYAPSLPAVLDGTLRDDIQRRRAIRDIARFALAKVDSTRNSIQVHRLVQAVLRDRLGPEQQMVYRKTVQEILAAYNPGDPTDDPSLWERHAEIGPHVEPSGAVESDDPDVRKVVLDQIRYLYVTGDYTSSRELGEVAYDLWTQQLGAESEQTIVTARFLANALRSTGDNTRTRELNTATLAIAREFLGEDHEHTLAIANSVGGDLRLAGEWERSRQLDEDLLARHRRVFGEDDPNTLRVANNLGVDLRLLGLFELARELDDDIWSRRQRVLGDDHPDTLHTVATGLSRDLYGLGRYAEAIDLQRRWLPLLKAKLGANHSNVLLATRIHAATLRKAGQAHAALEFARDAHRRRQQAFGEDHAETLCAALTLFTVLPRTDRVQEARLLGEETLAAFQRTMGEQHTFTAVCMTDLAIVLRISGDHRRARDLDTLALDLLMAALGPSHTYTICTAINASNNLAAAREHRAARDLLETTLVRARAMLGENHPESLGCAANLVLDLQACGQADLARDLREDTLSRLRLALGDDDHPDIEDMVQGRRLYCVVDPPPT